MTNAAPAQLGYRPELDGVRAIAVLAVLFFHLAFMAHWLTNIAQGGFLGVDVFFVLSGMLITELLIADATRHPVEALGAFYGRRARRLLPALAVMLVVAVGYYHFTRHTAKATTEGLWAVITYVTADHASHPFPAGVAQVWTLVVEWEFYLIWPAVLLALLACKLSRRTIGLLTAGAAVAVTLVRAAVFHHHETPYSYILNYHLAWLRFDELLVGCALALLGGSLRVPSWLRTIGLLAVLAAISRASYPDHWLYLGGMFGLALATAAVIAPRNSGGWWADRILASPPLVWIGKLSYSLYLWSVPAVGEVGRRGGSLPLIPRLPIAIAVSFGLATASYYLVESRLRMPSRRPLA